MIHVPLVMGAVVPTYNLPDQAGQPIALRFTGPILADIYLGKITKWNHPAIASVNPGQTLPDLKIEPVHRRDGSGTTAIWTDFLCKASARWKSQIGSGTTVTWPGGTAAEKNDGVADAVSRTDGAIGYVELSFALANNLPVGMVKNKAGAFVAPSIEGITTAAASLKPIPPDLRYSLTDAPGQASYPIVGTTWAIVYIDQPSGKGRELARFFRWATGEGQNEARQMRVRAFAARAGATGSAGDRAIGWYGRRAVMTGSHGQLVVEGRWRRPRSVVFVLCLAWRPLT